MRGLEKPDAVQGCVCAPAQMRGPWKLIEEPAEPSEAVGTMSSSPKHRRLALYF